MKLLIKNKVEAQNTIDKINTEASPLLSSPANVHYKKNDQLAQSPIGLLGFAISCFICGCSYLHLTTYDTIANSILFFHGGLCQYIIGFYDWYRGNAIGALLSITYGLYNMSFVPFFMFGATGTTQAFSDTSMAWYNAMWAFYMVFVAIGVFPGAKIVFINDICVLWNFSSQAGYYFSKKDGVGKSAGVAMLCTACITVYIFFSNLVKAIYKKNFLPLVSPGEKIDCPCLNKEIKG